MKYQKNFPLGLLMIQARARSHFWRCNSKNSACQWSRSKVRGK
jgi:hypothetical protein